MALTDMDEVIVDGNTQSTPQSRSESILRNLINGDTDDGKVEVDGDHQSFVPQSRMEALLRAIPGSGGGISEARARELIDIAVDDLIGDSPADGDTLEKLNEKIVTASGSMFYQYITLTPSDLSASSTYADFPYEYNLTFTGLSEVDFTDASIEGLNYDGSYFAKSGTNKVMLYFSKLPSESVNMYVYGNISKSYSPQTSAVYTVAQINEMFGIGSEETGATATHTHAADTYFIWNGHPYRALTNIAIGDALGSSNVVAEDLFLNYYTKPEINTQMGYAGVETGASASKAYSAGDFFLWQGQVAKAIADIAQGGAISGSVQMSGVFDEIAKLSKIGEMVESDGITTIIPSGAWTAARSITLSRGVYFVRGFVTFLATIPSCEVGIGFTLTAGTNAGLMDTRKTTSNLQTRSSGVAFLTVPADTTYYLNVYQNCGSTTTIVVAGLQAIRIS